MKKSHLWVLTLVLSLFIVMPSYANTKTKHHASHTSHKVHNVHKIVKRKMGTNQIKHKGNTMVGFASWYGYESGPKTASGELFNPKKLTAAHRSLKFGTKVKVTNLDNKKSVIVTVNDRGPSIKNRIIDLSKGAAKVIGMNGIEKVSISIM
jgi:rare lipoprotein A